MKDLTSPRLMWLKGALFLLIALTSAILLWLESPKLRTTLCLVLLVWAACRAYYFAFYVLEHYADNSFSYSGLISVGRYILRKRSAKSSRIS